MELKRSKTLINRKYMEYFIPTVLTAMANNIAVMVDATIVGNLLGSAELASVNLLSPFNQLYFSLSILFGLASATIIVKAKGADGTDKKTCNEVFTSTFITLLIISIILMITQFIFIDNIVSILTPDAHLQELVKQYYIPLIAGTPITLFMTSGIHIIRTDGRPKFASNIIIIANLVNLSMDLITIEIFKLGIMGASIATITGNFVGFIMILTHFKRKDNTLKFDFSILKNLSIFGKHFINLVTTGASGALGTMLITIRMLFLNTIIQKYGGKSALIAYSVVSLCQIFVSAFVTGASQTMIPIVSLLIGEKDFSGVKIAFNRALKILLISSITITVLVEIAPGFIAQLYGLHAAEDLAMGISALRISSLLFPALALSFLALYYFMCTGKKGSSTLISIVNGIVFIVPFGLIFAYLFDITGVWISLVASQFATLLFAIATAFVLKHTSKGKYKNLYLLEENNINEVASFSVDENSVESVKKYVTAKSDEKTADIVAKVIDIIKNSELEKHRKQNNTDIRICKNEGFEVMIKNSGAIVDENSFSNLNGVKYSKALGFNQIRIDI